jgi:cell division transport system permease protein
MRRLLARYLELHVQNLVAAFGRALAQPLANLMTVVVIGIALALPAGLGVLLANAEALSGSWEGVADFTVYLKAGIDEDRGREVARAVESRSDVGAVEFISRSDALAEFRAHSGFGEALEALPENPLPNAFVVRPASGARGDVEALAGALDAMDETDVVQLDTAWVDRLRAMLDLGHRVVEVAAVWLAIGVLLVIGNTIRLEINNRREEIIVVKLVGGSDGFIRRPFLYLGSLYGLVGGLVAALLIEVALGLLRAPVRSLAELYGSGYALAGLSGRDLLILFGGGGLLGWIGAGLATARHLRAIEPQ